MATGQNKQSAAIAVSWHAITALSAIATLLVLAQVLKYSAYGIEFTDESFYLIWISNPFNYDSSTTQFGFIYHPLYILLGGDVAALRQANILITFIIAWVLIYLSLTSFAQQPDGTRTVPIVIAAGLATSAFLVFDTWLLLPNYNSLTLQALLLACIGLLLSDKAATRVSIAGAGLIGIGGWLAFMAKPSAALALAATISIYLLISRKLTVRLVLVGTTTIVMLFLASAWLIDGSIAGFVQRFEWGLESNQILGAGHTWEQILRIDDFQLGEKAEAATFGAALATFLATWGVIAKNKKGLAMASPILLACFLLIATLVSGTIHQVADLGPFESLLVLGVAYSAVAVSFAFGRIEEWESITLSDLALLACFVVMPHVYAFGTNNNYWASGSSAGIFWLLASIGLMTLTSRLRPAWAIAMPAVLVAQAVVAVLLHTALEQPYRQPGPLRTNQTPSQFGSSPSPLMLSTGYAAYVEAAATAAKNAKLQPGTPVIDLSGQSPGILYVMGGESLGQAWNIGGYPGSLKRAAIALNRVDCTKIGSAWVLSEPLGPRAISIDLLLGQGLRFPEDYKMVGTWFTAEGAGSFNEKRQQYLYAPLKPQENSTSCRANREK